MNEDLLPTNRKVHISVQHNIESDGYAMSKITRRLPRTSDFRTFVTEQQMLLFMQIAVLLGLLVQVIMFVALLWYGRPPEGQYSQIHDFFLVSAVWVLTIDAGVVLFWWVTKQGKKREEGEEQQYEITQ